MKLKKNLKFGLISGLCTASLVAGAILTTSCSTTTNTNSKTNLTNNPENSVYHTITFATRGADEKLIGKTTLEVRDGNEWSSVKKPAAEKPDHELTGWQISDGSGGYTDLTNSTPVTGNWTVYPKFTPIAHNFTVFGGTQYISLKNNDTGKDESSWHLYDNGQLVPDTDVTFSLSMVTGSKPDWLHLGPWGAHTDYAKGQISWANAVQNTAIQFKVGAKREDQEIVYSDVISLNVNTAEYQIKDGHASLSGVVGAPGADTTAWHLYNESGQVAAATLALYAGEPAPAYMSHISITNGIVSWDASLAVGKYEFVVYSDYPGDRISTETVTLHIIPAEVKLTGGSTLIEIGETAEGEADPWSLVVGSEPVTDNVTWGLTGAPAHVALKSNSSPTAVIQYGKDGGHVAPGQYSFTLKGTYGSYSAEETIHMHVTASEATIEGGVSTISVKDDETLAVSNLFTLQVNGAARTDATWDLEGEPTGVRIDRITTPAEDLGKGQITCENVSYGDIGSYTFQVVGKSGTDYVARKTILLVVTQDTVKVTYTCNTAAGERLDGGQTDISVYPIKDQSADMTNAAKSPTTFAELYKPLATKPGQYFDHWEYKTQPGTAVPSAATFKAETSIVPVFKVNPVIKITGSDNMYATTSLTYSAEYADSANDDSQFTWKVIDWQSDASHASPEWWPEIDPETGVLEAKNAAGTVTIEAFDNVSKVSTTKSVGVYYPWQYSYRFWVYGNVEGTGDGWYYFTQENSGSEDPIQLYSMSDTLVKEEPRKDTENGFNREIWVGDYISTIPDSFLADCYNFDSPIHFSNESQCTVIENGFLDECKKFNQLLTLPSKLNTIWDNFMVNCESFNNGASATTLTLPSTLTRIGDWFMYNCISFNQSFELSEKIKHIGNGFLQNCYSMIGTIYVKTSVTSFDNDGDTGLSFACDRNDKPMVQTGIFLRGDTAAEIANIELILDQFENWPITETHDNYRNLRLYNPEP